MKKRTAHANHEIMLNSLKWGLFGMVISIITFSGLGYMLGTTFDRQVILVMIVAAVASGILILRIWPVILNKKSDSPVNEYISTEGSNK